MSVTFGDSRLPARFWAKVRLTDTCWTWVAGLRDKKGYGSFGAFKGRTWLAHRAAYEELVGPVPGGHELDHLCRNRRCVNPTHLDPVAHRENVTRGAAPARTRAAHAAKTHCPRGHEYTEENTYYQRRRADGYVGRVCRACHRDRQRARNAR